MYTWKDIEKLLGENIKIVGDVRSIQFDNVSTISSCNERSLCWLKQGIDNKDEIINNSPSRVIICGIQDVFTANESKVFIQVQNPRLTYLRIVKTLYTKPILYSIHPSAIINSEAILHEEVYIGPHCIIGKCKIGKGTSIQGNCYIFDNVEIKNNVSIMPNCTIGGVGFGYEKDEKGKFELFPHIGGVIIEDNVDIGANTCIDRGTLGNTIIGENSKIDNLVHIAHNVRIGKNCAIIAHAMIGGSTIINDNSWIAPTACLREGISIGQNATIGLGAVVIKSIPANEVWAGNPAKKFR